MKKIIIIVSLVLGVLLIGTTIFFTATPAGRGLWNDYDNTLRQVDDETSYEIRKKVEDTCRSLMASYKTDKATYEAYKDSDDAVLKSSANQARIRANQTANSYNEYILKNSYVWKDNVPEDIAKELELI